LNAISATRVALEATRIASSSTLRLARAAWHEARAGDEHEAQIFLSIQHFFCTNACKLIFVLLYSFSFGA
jgi:hypothetical protein